MKIAICKEPFDPWQELASFQSLQRQHGRYGATASFVGTLRDVNEGEQVREMELEYYPGMTEQHLQAIGAAAMRQWELLDVLILHRAGHLHVGDPIVLVAVWSAHRAAAFDACRFIMEDLKAKAPFWKQETLADGRRRWVETNTPG